MIVHCLWIGGRLSALERLALASHVRVGHACRLWVYEPVDNVPPGIAVDDAGAILPRDRIFTYRHGPGKGSVAAFANLFRYKLLCRLGGWWCDTDVVCLKPFDFPGDCVFASERTPQGVQERTCSETRERLRWSSRFSVPSRDEQSPGTLKRELQPRARSCTPEGVQVNNCVIKAPPESPVLRYCLKAAERRDPASLNWGDTGPRLLTEAVRRFGLDAAVAPPETFCPVHFFDAAAVLDRPADLRSPPLRHAHAVHLWHELWRRHGWDKDATYPGHCLYETLKRLVLG